MIRRIAAALIGLGLLAGLVVLPTASVAAAGVPAPTTANAIVTPVSTTVKLASDYYYEDPTGAGDYWDTVAHKSFNRPINRWFFASTGLHSRFSFIPGTQLAERLQRDMGQRAGMFIGNTVWFLTGELSRGAVEFEMLDVAGKAVDNAAGKIGQTIVGTPIVATTILLIAVGGAFLAVFRRKSTAAAALKQTVGIIIVFGLLAVMSAGALNSRDVNGRFVPGAGSPGWIVKGVTDAVANVASIPASALSGVLTSSAIDLASGGEHFSCNAYLQNMSSATLNTGTPKYAIGEVINSLWMVTGVTAWKHAQFGNNNQYTNYMYCRMLDQTAVSESEAEMMTRGRAGPRTGTSVPAEESLVWAKKDNASSDATMVGWAACRAQTKTPKSAGDWKVAGAWGNTDRMAKPVTTDDCHKWWTGDFGADFGVILGASLTPGAAPTKEAILGYPESFIFNGDRWETMKRTSDPEIRNFLTSMHGSDPGNVSAGSITVATYAVAALISGAVLSGISLMTMAAKVYMVVFMVTLFLVMVVSMFSRNPMGERLTKMFSHFIGITLFSFGISLIFALVALMTKVLVDFGMGMWGGANPVTLVWSGLAPVFSLMLLHMAFTKVLKLPSPLTRAGALGWGAAGGAAGGAIVGSMASKAARSVGNRVMEGVTDKAMHVATGGKVGQSGGVKRKHAMGGGDRETTGAGDLTGAAGGAAGAELPGGSGAAGTGASAPSASLTKRQQKRADREELKAAKAAKAVREEKARIESGVPDMNDVDSAGNLIPKPARRGKKGRVGTSDAPAAATVAAGALRSRSDKPRSPEAREALVKRKAAAIRRADLRVTRGSRSLWARASDSVTDRLGDGARAIGERASDGAEAVRAGAAGAAAVGTGLASLGREARANAPGAFREAGKSMLDGGARALDSVDNLVEKVRQDPAAALDKAAASTWSGIKTTVSATGRGTAATWRVGAKVAASKGVRTAAVVGFSALALTATPLTGVPAAAILLGRARKANGVRRERNAATVREYRAENETAAAAERQAAQAAFDAQEQAKNEANKPQVNPVPQGAPQKPKQ